MQNWVPIFRLATKTSPLLPPSSSSLTIFFNGVFDRNGEAILWILPPSNARFIPILKLKHQLNTHKHAGNRTATKKSKNKTGAGDARSCVPHHGPWCSLPGPIPTLLERCVLSYFVPWDLPWIFMFWAYWACFSTLGLASTHLFLLKLGPNHANLQLYLNKAKIERNRRNTCKNRFFINQSVWHGANGSLEGRIVCP